MTEGADATLKGFYHDLGDNENDELDWQGFLEASLCLTDDLTSLGGAHVGRMTRTDVFLMWRHHVGFDTVEFVFVELSPQSLHECITAAPWTSSVSWFILGSYH
jgi:hypothetical protein